MTKRLALLALLVVSAARADDFDFTIPIKAQHLMPSVARIRVICNVYKQKPAGFLINGPDLIGQGITTVPVPASGTVNVTEDLHFYAAAGENGHAKHYQCGFYLETATTHAIPDTSHTELGGVFQAKPGTSLTVKQEGDMPSGFVRP